MLRRDWLLRTLGGMGGALATPKEAVPAAKHLLDGFTDVINVAMYGARGDGVTDDHRAVQLALDDAAKRPTGGVVTFPSGVYALGAPLRVQSRVTILALGSFPRYARYPNAPTLPVTLRSTKGFPRESPLLDVRRASYTHVEGVEILGDGSPGPDQTDGTTTGIAYGTAGQSSTGSLWSGHMVRNCSIVGHRYGVHAKDASYHWWEFTNVAVCWAAGVFFEAWCGDSTLVGMYANRCNAHLQADADPSVGYGVFLGNGTSNVNMIGGKVENNGRGLQITESCGVNVVGVSFHNNGHYHVGLRGGAHAATSVQLSGCRLLGGGLALAGRGGAHLRLETSVNARAGLTASGCSFKAGSQATALDYDPAGPRGPDHVAWASGRGSVTLLLTGSDCADACTLGKTAAVHFERGLRADYTCVA